MTDADAAEIASLKLALESRTQIGMAMGLVMERFDLSADEAFAFLSRVSSTTERKLRDVAAELVITRRVPE